MSILINQDTRVLFQGFTGSQATFHAKKSIEYGTKVIGGVTPGKGGQTHLDLPVYNSVAEATLENSIDASIIYVPASACMSAIVEAINSDIPLIVCITEGIPIHDMLKIKKYLSGKPHINLIGPNCPGIITPAACRIGIMPGYIHTPGSIGIVSRSGTLTYEAVQQTTELGYGQSTCVGIGGDPIHGMNFVDVLTLFENDNDTSAVVMVGEIGGVAEETAAEFIKTSMSKPVIAYIAGITAPTGKRMGHAGAIIDGGKGSAKDKIAALKQAGVITVDSPTKIGQALTKILG